MKKLVALVLSVLSLFTFTTAAFAGDEPLYGASQIANELKEVFGYEFKVNLRIQDNHPLEGKDEVYFEIYNPLREEYFSWKAENILSQYVLTYDSLWDMINTYPNWEMLPWEKNPAEGRHFWFAQGAEERLAQLIDGQFSLDYEKSEETLVITLATEKGEISRVLDLGEFTEVDNLCIVEQSVLTDLYREWQER